MLRQGIDCDLAWVFFSIPKPCNLRSYFLKQKKTGFHRLSLLGDSAFKIQCRLNVIWELIGALKEERDKNLLSSGLQPQSGSCY